MARTFGPIGELTVQGIPLTLNPDLAYPANRFSQNNTYIRITGIDASAGLTTALSLTGKYAVSYLEFKSVSIENMTIKLTIDGVIIWNSTFLTDNQEQGLFGNNSSDGDGPDEILQCNDSFLLEVQMASDTSIDLNYLARPIL